MRAYILSFLLFLSLVSLAQYQDTLRLVHYNILNYRNHFDACTQVSNNIEGKEANLRTILNYVQADLISFNEVANRASAADSLKLMVLDQLGGFTYQMGEFSGNSFLANALFYRSDKLVYQGKSVILKDLNGSALVRQIDVHRMYYKQQAALNAGDTTFLVVYQAHLKAGNDLDDLDERNLAVEAMMKYHNDNHRGLHYVLMADLNVKSSNEDAYKKLTSEAASNIRFNDPLDREGAWNSNSNYADIHSQSTRSSETNNDCFSGGGLDDRFDFILCGAELLDGFSPIQYLNGSYKSLGNDGLHFNKDLLSPMNNSAPDSVINALYACSDHLPILADFEISSEYSSMPQISSQPTMWTLKRHELDILSAPGMETNVTICDLLGRPVFKAKLSESRQKLNLAYLQDGVYVLMIQAGRNAHNQRIVLRP